MPESWTITAREAAGLVGVSRQTFRRWVAQGKMPPPVINRRYSREQVRAEARGEWEPGAAWNAGNAAAAAEYAACFDRITEVLTAATSGSGIRPLDADFTKAIFDDVESLYEA